MIVHVRAARSVNPVLGRIVFHTQSPDLARMQSFISEPLGTPINVWGIPYSKTKVNMKLSDLVAPPTGPTLSAYLNELQRRAVDFAAARVIRP